MVMLEFTPMTFLKWALLACLVCSSLSLQIPNLTQSCDPNDLRALKEFAGNLTNGSIFFLWSNDSHCCRWDGVGCEDSNNGSVASRVTSLILPHKGLKGVNLTALGRLDHLKFLDLSSNQLDGELSMELSNLHQLEVLDLSYNKLLGPVSRSLLGLKSIKSLNISSNLFSGDFLGVGGFLNLVVFNISNNFFNGSISSQFCSSSNAIQMIDLSMNHFTGGLEGLGNCSFTSLQNLHVDYNSLSGQLPEFLFSLPSLEQLSIPGNNFSGHLSRKLSIPLYVKRNQSANGLQYNQVSSFPPSIFLSNNRINGTIWPEIGKLKQLHVLDLSRNNITGTIPDSISNMGNLEVLDLSCNDLHGEIPSSLNKLTFLSKFSVADNQLRGMIPTGGQFLSFPNSSFEGNPGLCGEVYIPCDTDDTMDPKPEIRASSNGKFGQGSIFGITISVGVGIALLLAVVWLRMSRRDVGDPIVDLDEEISRPHRLSEVLGSSKLVLFQNSGCKDLSVADLLKSTNNFNQANIIGCGGFGLVYKANLPDGTRAAIKRLSGDCGQMEREFRAEVEALSRAQHKNLVSLQGYCRHGNDRLLIYSYMENGSLDYWLHERVDGGSFLTWDTRVKIAQGAGRGLAYLHKVCEPSVVHRDIKSSNILLDETFEAHLADFGLSRLLRPYDTHVTTDLVGTLGYIPPEYSQTLTATFKGDVYSFGVVLLELLTGRRPVEVCKGKNCRDLVSWVFQMKSEKKEEQIMDSSVWDKDREKQFLEVLGIACRCIDQDPRQRPSIDQVVSWLDAVGKEGV
ncbi:hypothetical protein AAG906_027083 [Vitis piasezkii]